MQDDKSIVIEIWLLKNFTRVFFIISVEFFSILGKIQPLACSKQEKDAKEVLEGDNKTCNDVSKKELFELHNSKWWYNYLKKYSEYFLTWFEIEKVEWKQP